MKRWLCLGLALLLLLPSFAFGGGEAPRIFAPAEVIRPGRASVIRFILPAEGNFDILLEDAEGSRLSVVTLNHPGQAGEHTLYWNGTYEGAPAPKGPARLVLKTAGGTAEAPVVIGEMAPCLIGVSFSRAQLTAGRRTEIRFYATEEGTVTLSAAEGEKRKELASWPVSEGNNVLSWTPELAEGAWELVLTLSDGETVSEESRFLLTAAAPVPEEAASVFTPSFTSPYAGQDATANYWTMPMDITDEAAVWQALTAPMTVIDNGQTEKAQIVLRSEPSSESPGVGSVTCMTQGVHVLERGEEWSLVECYSSSFHDSPILNWNALVQGYVPTAYLTEIIPNQEMGFVIDKLTQRLYIFREGHLFTTLLVSTGLSNARQPYNETRSGEFLMTSKVGTFSSDNLRCGLAIRFNKGDLLHEVPYISQGDGSKNYSVCEPKLGTKASHGCIRVQRKPTPEGVNMGWIWNNHKANTRLMIWEDWQGRQIPVPGEEMTLWYNPKGGQFYHSKDHCESVQRASVVFEPFSYALLDEKPYAKLKRCEYCAPPLRRAEIEKINGKYVLGGDHDPILTKAREKCPRPLK